MDHGGPTSDATVGVRAGSYEREAEPGIRSEMVVKNREKCGPKIALDFRDICDLLGVRKKHLDEAIASGDFPAPFQLGSVLRWRTKDVDKYLLRKSYASRVHFDPKRISVDADYPPGEYPEELKDIHSHLFEYTMFRSIPCVYFLISFGQIVYVGQSKCLPLRVGQHKQSTKKAPKKNFDRVLFLRVPYEKLCDAESYYIKLLDPILNKSGFGGVPEWSAPEKAETLQDDECLTTDPDR
jgi:predicted DNA-binding transcriptional regulator AlpA